MPNVRSYYVVRVKTPLLEYVLLKNGREFKTEDIDEAWCAADRFLPYVPPDSQVWVAVVTESEVHRDAVRGDMVHGLGPIGDRSLVPACYVPGRARLGNS